MKLAPLFLLTAALTAQSFDYDTHQPFDVSCEDLSHRPDAELHGCGFTGPRGGKVNLVYIRPKNVRPPYAGVIFQHGGGQSMTHYLNEALILARAGVVSVIPDAPSRRDPPPSDDDKLGPSELQTEVVITERRMLDWLLQQPGVDPKRIAYVGHSYGGVAGSFLSAVEPRFTAFVLLGAVVPEKDPDRYLPHAHAPMLVQCARFDTDHNVRGCPEVHRLAGGPKRIVWYDDDHYFTSLEALRDRLAWLQQYLRLKPLQPEIVQFLNRPPAR